MSGGEGLDGVVRLDRVLDAEIRAGIDEAMMELLSSDTNGDKRVAASNDAPSSSSSTSPSSTHHAHSCNGGSVQRPWYLECHG